MLTDHKPQESLNSKFRPGEELDDITNYLSQFNQEGILRPGIFNEEADCLLRNPVLPCEKDENDCELIWMINTPELKDIQEGQKGIEKKKRTMRPNGILFKRVKKNE